MQKNKTAIWVPAQKKHGLGHYFRNKWIIEKSVNVSYFFNEELEYSIDESKVHLLSNDPEAIEKFLLSQKFHCLLIDHYFLSPEILTYFLNHRKMKVIWFDYDFSAPKFDALINSNIFANLSMYKDPPKEVELFLGEEYFGFRKEFYQVKPINKKDDYVFISFGGSDILNLTLDILDKVDYHYTYQVCLGRGCSQEYLGKVKDKFAKTGLKGEVHFDPKNYLELLSSSSFAILTSSTSTYEAEYFGVRYVAFNVVNNQDLLAAYLAKNGISVIKKVSDFKMSPSRSEFKNMGLKFSANCDQFLSFLEA